MTNDFGAIETRYRGHRFRSRLEARWAVFMDCLQIQFWYELEGFTLPDGRRYLPDFYLPQVRMWAEVKPDILDSDELAKCRQLTAISGKKTLLLVGPPDFQLYEAFLPVQIQDGSEAEMCNFLLDIDYHGRKLYNERWLFGSVGAGFAAEEDFTAQYREAVFVSRAYRFEEAA